MLALLAACSSGSPSPHPGTGGGAGPGVGGAAATGGGGAVGSGGAGSPGTGGGAGSPGTGGAGAPGTGGAGPTCPVGRTLCGAECVDFTSDPLHCNGCDSPCGPNQVCNNATCQTPPDCRSAACVGLSFCDLATGLCNPGCAFDAQCSANESCDIATHACVCKTGNHRCSGVCVASNTVATCGTSCTPCATDPNGTATCNGTTCGLTCNAGTKLCGGVCAACPTANVAATVCSGTQCVASTCATGYHVCSGACLSNSSVASCGTSSCTACPTPANATATCDGTACGSTCNSGYRLCNGACAACPTANVVSTTCSGSACVALQCTSGGNYHICSGACVSNTSPLTCGSSCTPCPTLANATATCNGATCALPCNTGYAKCGSVCAACPTPAATTICSGTTCLASSCDSTRHVCSGACVLNSSPDTCGTSCTPCPAPPANAAATCGGTTCGFKCNTGYAACGSACCSDCRQMSGACTGLDWCGDLSGRCEPVQKVQPSGMYAMSLETFGSHVSMSGAMAAVGGPREGDRNAGISFGGVYVFARQPSGSWTLVGSKLQPNPLSGSAFFGSAVSLSGQRLLVGAPTEVMQVGAAYIYDLVSGVWTQRAKLLGPEQGDQFGAAAALDGDRAIVGANNYIGSTQNRLGYVYIYERQPDGTWPATGVRLNASDGYLSDKFGLAVSLSGDRALVGSGRREAYVIARQSDGTWAQEQILTPTGSTTTDQFATAVSLSGDRALVGAYQDGDQGANTGAVYVFERQSSGVWMQTAKLYAPAPNGADSFGVSVAQSGDRVLVGADTRGGNVNGGPGAAYLFVHNSDGSWTTPVEVMRNPADVSPSGMFGSDVGLSGDFAVVGAQYDAGNLGTQTGAAYIADVRAFLP